jgi:hypothetical protein
MIKILGGDFHSLLSIDKWQEFLVISTYIISNNLDPGKWSLRYRTDTCATLYGLRQAPCAWFSRLYEQLLNYGFTGDQSNISLFIYHWESTLIYLFLIYIDDIILTRSSSTTITDVIYRWEFIVIFLLIYVDDIILTRPSLCQRINST